MEFCFRATLGATGWLVHCAAFTARPRRSPSSAFTVHRRSGTLEQIAACPANDMKSHRETLGHLNMGIWVLPPATFPVGEVGNRQYISGIFSQEKRFILV